MTHPTTGLGLVEPSPRAASSMARRMASASACGGHRVLLPLRARTPGPVDDDRERETRPSRTAHATAARDRCLGRTTDNRRPARPWNGPPAAHCLPSGLSPSVQEFHLVNRPLDADGSRTITAGSELHRPRSALLLVQGQCATPDRRPCEADGVAWLTGWPDSSCPAAPDPGDSVWSIPFDRTGLVLLLSASPPRERPGRSAPAPDARRRSPGPWPPSGSVWDAMTSHCRSRVRCEEFVLGRVPRGEQGAAQHRAAAQFARPDLGGERGRAARARCTRPASNRPPAWPSSPPSTIRPGSRTATTPAAPRASRSASASRKGPSASPHGLVRASPRPCRARRRGGTPRPRAPARGSPRRSRSPTAGRRCRAPAGSRSRPRRPRRPGAASRPGRRPRRCPGRARAGRRCPGRGPRRAAARRRRPGWSRSRPARRRAAAARGRRRVRGARRAARWCRAVRRSPGRSRPGAPIPTLCSRSAPASFAVRSSSGHGLLDGGPRPGVRLDRQRSPRRASRPSRSATTRETPAGADVQGGEMRPVGDDRRTAARWARAARRPTPPPRATSPDALEALHEVGDGGPGQSGELLQLACRQRALVLQQTQGEPVVDGPGGARGCGHAGNPSRSPKAVATASIYQAGFLIVYAAAAGRPPHEGGNPAR